MCKGISQEIIIGGNRYDHVIKLVKFHPTCLSIWVTFKKLCKNKHNNNFFEKQIYFVIDNILILQNIEPISF